MTENRKRKRKQCCLKWPHLDFHQDDQARQEFYQEFPVLDIPRSERILMLERTNDEEHKARCGNLQSRESE